SYVVPGDYSSAFPLLAAAGAAGGGVTVSGLEIPSGDADALALKVLLEMGLEIESAVAPGALTARAPRGRLLAVAVAATDFPAAGPSLAALAALAAGESRFEGIGHLRLKESDRIAALAGLLEAAGAVAEARDNCLVVRGPLDASADRPVERLPT